MGQNARPLRTSRWFGSRAIDGAIGAIDRWRDGGRRGQWSATVPRVVVVDMLARGVIIRASAVPSEARGATKKTRAVKARETIGAPAIAGALALALVASPLAARAEDAAFGVDYDAATKKTYNVREQYAKKPAKEYKKFVAPTREAPEPKAKPAPKEGGGFSLPSFSLPSISLPSFGGDAAESTESTESSE